MPLDMSVRWHERAVVFPDDAGPPLTKRTWPTSYAGHPLIR